MIMKAVDSYLSLRRAAGYALKAQEYLLRSFARFAAERGQVHISTPTVIEWASQALSLGNCDHRLKTVIAFARHLQVEDAQHEVPPSNVFGYRKTRRIPFIFTQGEIHHLIEAATCLTPRDSLLPHTYSILFALLAVTGLRISEALRLRFKNVTADGLRICRTKFQKSRLIPLHETAVAGLERYLERRKRTAAGDDHVFVSLRGRGLHRNTVDSTFRKLLKTIGLDQGRGGRRPRIQDLRNTFAVRALETCPEGRDNIGRHMVALSTYMGHNNIRHTYWYLEATPHLMQDIVEACEAFLRRGAQ